MSRLSFLLLQPLKRMSKLCCYCHHCDLLANTNVFNNSTNTASIAMACFTKGAEGLHIMWNTDWQSELTLAVVGEPSCNHPLVHFYCTLHLCSSILASSALGIQGPVGGTR